MKYTEAFDIIENAQSAFDTVNKIKSIDSKKRAAGYLLFIPLLTQLLNNNDSNLPEEKLKVVKHLSELLLKNNSVFKSGLITKEEFEKNGIELYSNLYRKLQEIKHSPKKASNIDVISLRANMDNINNYS